MVAATSSSPINYDTLKNIQVWMHSHPDIVKGINTAGFVIGVGALAASAVALPIIGAWTIAIAITGAALTLATAVGFYALGLIFPDHHDMKDHAFTPGLHDGGRLYYQGDVPVLKLVADPYRAGKAYGYLCGDSMQRLSGRFNFVLNTLLGRPRASELTEQMASFRRLLPPRITRELEGLVEGYNQWAQEHQHSPMTFDDALLFQLAPDSLHYQPGGNNGLINWELSPACTSLVARDPVKGMVLARNMDWPSLGLAGKYSLVVVKENNNGLRNTVSVAVPGLIGTLTGMNHHGLSVSMNVCQGKTETIRGLPAALYNRLALEECSDVNELEQLTQHRAPLGPYHLIAADRHNRGQSFHFYQSPYNTHVIRRSENSPLSTLNCRYEPNPNRGLHLHEERSDALARFFTQNRPLEEALSIDHVNNWETTHSVVMEPGTGTMKVAFDNAYSGHRPLHSLSIPQLLRV